VADDRRSYEIGFPLQRCAAGHDNAVWLCVVEVTFDLFELRLLLQRPLSVPCIAAPHMLPSALGDVLGLRKFRTFTARYPAPHNRCVRVVAGVPRNTRCRAGAGPCPDRTLTGWIRSAYPDAPPNVWTVLSMSSSTAWSSDTNQRWRCVSPDWYARGVARGRSRRPRAKSIRYQPVVRWPESQSFGGLV
jgi:hypothetical protein